MSPSRLDEVHEDLQEEAELARGDAQVGVVELVRDVPAERAEGAPLL